MQFLPPMSKRQLPAAALNLSARATPAPVLAARTDPMVPFATGSPLSQPAIISHFN